MCGSTRHQNRSMFNQQSEVQDPLEIEQNEALLANMGLIYCLNCGQSFISVDIRYCSRCGFEIKVCPISLNKFKVGDKYLQCPHCFNTFHYQHLDNWLRYNGKCPVCRQHIDSMITGIIGINKPPIR